MGATKTPWFNSKGLGLWNKKWHVVSVDPRNRDLLPRFDCKFFVIGDTKHTPPKIETSPEVTSNDLKGLILIACCVHPPFFLPQGHIITQAIPLPVDLPIEGQSPSIYWAEVVEDKPMINCELCWGGDYISPEGVLDTGADVTVIPTTKWTSQWELQTCGQ